jgi:hypothetical protein
MCSRKELATRLLLVVRSEAGNSSLAISAYKTVPGIEASHAALAFPPVEGERVYSDLIAPEL